jgi:hypothetical protein
MAYTPLQQGATPTLGTSGSAVLELQKKLNAQGAGLKEDALYGTLTAAAFAKYNQPKVDTNQPVGTAFQMPSIGNSYESDPNYIKSQNILANNLNGIDNVDTNSIRSSTLVDFQDRINAINQVYAGKLAEAKQQGVGRVGSTTSVLANRGLAGSARGGAIAEGTLTQNRQIEDVINAEKNAAIQAIYSDVNSIAQAEAERRRQALEGGAKSYIDFIKGQEATKQTNLGNTVGAFIAQGIDPSTLTPDELKGIADKLKVTTGDIVSSYKQKKYEQKQAEIKANPAKELSQGEALYNYDPTTGTYKQVGFNPKTSVAKSGTGGTKGIGKYSTDLDALIGNTVATIPTKFGQEQFNVQLSKARNEADKISLIGSVVLKNAPAPVKQDFSNQSIAISNIDKAIAEIDKGAKSGFINDKLQKGFNIVGRDYDPSLASIAAYVTSAVQPYRNSVTGAAWGSQEEAEYSQLFGSTSYSPTELKQRLTRLKEIMRDKSAQGLNVYINPMNTYANPFVTGSQTSFNTQQSNTVTVYSVKTGAPAQIPADKVQQALSSGLFRQ